MNPKVPKFKLDFSSIHAGRQFSSLSCNDVPSPVAVTLSRTNSSKPVVPHSSGATSPGPTLSIPSPPPSPKLPTKRKIIKSAKFEERLQKYSDAIAETNQALDSSYSPRAPRNSEDYGYNGFDSVRPRRKSYVVRPLIEEFELLTSRSQNNNSQLKITSRGVRSKSYNGSCSDDTNISPLSDRNQSNNEIAKDVPSDKMNELKPLSSKTVHFSRSLVESCATISVSTQETVELAQRKGRSSSTKSLERLSYSESSLDSGETDKLLMDSLRVELSYGDSAALRNIYNGMNKLIRYLESDEHYQYSPQLDLVHHLSELIMGLFTFTSQIEELQHIDHEHQDLQTMIQQSKIKEEMIALSLDIIEIRFPEFIELYERCQDNRSTKNELSSANSTNVNSETWTSSLYRIAANKLGTVVRTSGKQLKKLEKSIINSNGGQYYVLRESDVDSHNEMKD